MKHKFIAKRYWKNADTAMGQSDKLARAYEDVIDLSLGDPDIITDSVIMEKAFDDARLGHTKYTDFRGDPELRNEIARFYKEEYNMDIDDTEIIVTTSGTLSMFYALEACIDDGDEVIMQSPCFTPYPKQIELARGVVVPLDTYENEGFQINVERLEGLITPRTKAIIVNYPTNPTGACFSRKTLNDIADIAIKHDLLVFSDDIYTLYCFNEPFIPLASLPGMFERTITINSFSKDFIMTGWRIGNIVAPAPIVKVITQINENVAFTSPSISQRAAIHALRNRKEVQPKLFNELKSRVFAVSERVNSIPNMSVLPPLGTFYLFINIKKTGLTSRQVADKILHEAHVLVLPGDTFGACGEGYLRAACVWPLERLNEAFDRIAAMPMFQ